MSGDWPADPADPRCPECGEPVSATASFCMHCEADLPSLAAEAGAESATEAGTATPGARHGRAGADGDRQDGKSLLDPESTLDDVSTVAVGAVGGLLVAIPTAVVGLVYARSALWFFLFPVVWIGVGLYVAYTYSVFGAVRKAAYLLAAALAVFPLFWFGPALEGGDLGGRVVGTLITAVVTTPIAVGLVGLGYWLGGKAPEQ